MKPNRTSIALAALAFTLMMASCQNTLSDSVEAEVQAAAATGPVVDSFTLTNADTYDGAVTFTIVSAHPGTNAAAVTHWQVTESSSAPGSGGWTTVTAAPSGGTYSISGSVTLGSLGSYGDRTLYAWLKNERTLVSSPATAAASTVHYRQLGAPTVNITLTSATPTDNPAITFGLSSSTVGEGAGSITGWLVTEDASSKTISDIPTCAAPTGYTLALTAGAHTFYVWAKNDQGKIGYASGAVAINQRSATLPDLPFITGHEQLTVTFDVAMSSAALTGGGTMNPKTPDSGDWNTPHTTLTVSSLSVWPQAGGSITVNGTTSYGIPITAASRSYTVFHGACVRAGDLNATDTVSATTGTLARPNATIAGGINTAATRYTIGSREVRVAPAAVSPYEYQVTSGITMQEGISLKGGYAADWKSRDITGNVTIIRNIASGGTETNTISCPAAPVITTATLIEGFAIYGYSGSGNTRAIYCAGASPTIRQNIIMCGGDYSASYRYAVYLENTGTSSNPVIEQNQINGSGQGGGTNIVECHGIYLQGGNSPTIRDNVIYGGEGQNVSTCIYSWDSSSNPIIVRNTIRGGKSDNTISSQCYGVCLASSSASVLIANNLIVTGKASSSTGSGWTCGIFIHGTGPTIRNNTIQCGKSVSEVTYNTYGIRINNNACAPYIDNNILFFVSGSKAYGIYEAAASTVPTLVRNNDLYFTENAGLVADYYDNNSTEYNATAIPAANNASGNISVDPVFDSNLYPSATSVTGGGLDGAANSWSFSDDRNGTTRTGNGTTGWSMGCYEVN